MNTYKCVPCGKIFTGEAPLKQHEASEKHKKKVSSWQITDNPLPGHDGVVLSQSPQISIPCATCSLNFSGIENYQRHVNSLQHAERVQSMITENPGAMGVEDFEFGGDHLNHKVTLTSQCHAGEPYAECIDCGEKFSGPEAYQSHINNPQHALKDRSNHTVATNSHTESWNAHPNNSMQPIAVQAIKPYAECIDCGKAFSGPEPYQQHLISNGHKKMIARMPKLQDYLENDGKDLTEKSRISEIVQIVNLPFYASCEPCKKQFSGKEPYQQHLVSAGHIKKTGIAVDINRVDNLNTPNGTSNLYSNDSFPIVECIPCQTKFFTSDAYTSHLESDSHKIKMEKAEAPLPQVLNVGGSGSNSLKCDVCNLICTGPIPYNDHLRSKVHLKKLLASNIFKGAGQSVFSEADSTVSDVPDNRSTGIAQNWYCDICKTQCSGPVPFNQHLESEDHKKQKRLSDMNVQFQRSCDLSTSSGECSQTESQSSGAANSSVALDSDLVITVFGLDDEINFDNIKKENKSSP